MVLKMDEPREPNMDPRTEVEQLHNVILFQEQQMRQEIERGNDLCEIIFNMIKGSLNEPQQERVERIIKNIKHRNKLR